MINFFKKIVEKEFEKISWGKVKFNFNNILEKKYIGKSGNLESNMIINDYSVFKDLVLRGDLGFAESYIAKKWDTSNLNHLLKILLKNQQIKKNNWKPSFYNKIIESVNFILKKNTINQAKKNISFHYDLGNNFYKEWLDNSMTYSSALFKNKQITLHEAQKQKYNSILENLNINSTSEICEIGCGWGGFINQSKQKNNAVNIDGFTISKNQYGYAKLNHENIFFEDYRKINKKSGT